MSDKTTTTTNKADKGKTLAQKLEALSVRMIARAVEMEQGAAELYLAQCADAWEGMELALGHVKAKERPEAFGAEVKRQEERFAAELGEKPGIVRLIGIHWLVKLVEAEKRDDIDVSAITPWAWREFVVFVEQDDKDGDTYLTAPYLWKETPTKDNAKEDGSAQEEALALLAEVSSGELTTRDIMAKKAAIIGKYFPGRVVAGTGGGTGGGDPAKKSVNRAVRQITEGLKATPAIRREAFKVLATKGLVTPSQIIALVNGMDNAGRLDMDGIEKILSVLEGIAVRMRDESEPDAEAPVKGSKGRKAAAATA